MRASGWQGSRPLWSGVAIVAMWTTVVVVALFGGDIRSQSAASGSSVPSYVAVVPFVFLATILVARWGLRPGRRAPESDDGSAADRRTDPGRPPGRSVEAPDAPHAPRA